MIKVIHCTVNGKVREIAVDERESLTDMLRLRLGLTSVKKGCEAGECGACTVLIDGVAKNSCILRRPMQGQRQVHQPIVSAEPFFIIQPCMRQKAQHA